MFVKIFLNENLCKKAKDPNSSPFENRLDC